MTAITNQNPLTEDVVLYFLYRRAKKRESRVFFKIKHTYSLETIIGSVSKGWWFAPDVDMLEITLPGGIIGYEVKGQQRKKEGYKWPRLYSGLDEALFYLRLPRIGRQEQKGGGY